MQVPWQRDVTKHKTYSASHVQVQASACAVSSFGVFRTFRNCSLGVGCWVQGVLYQCAFSLVCLCNQECRPPRLSLSVLAHIPHIAAAQRAQQQQSNDTKLTRHSSHVSPLASRLLAMDHRYATMKLIAGTWMRYLGFHPRKGGYASWKCFHRRHRLARLTCASLHA